MNMTYPVVIVVKTPERFVVCQQSQRNPRLYLMVTDLCYEHFTDAERGAAAHEHNLCCDEQKVLSKENQP